MTQQIISRIAPALLLLGLLSACKERTCECTLYNPNHPEPLGGQTTFPVKGSRKKQKERCTDRSTPPDEYGRYRTCVIK
jgi:hypothetical protein